VYDNFLFLDRGNMMQASEAFVQHGLCVSGRIVRIETFEQLINVGVGRQFSVSKAHQRKARNRYRSV